MWVKVEEKLNHVNASEEYFSSSTQSGEKRLLRDENTLVFFASSLGEYDNDDTFRLDITFFL